MRISDWSSDVCSSDLNVARQHLERDALVLLDAVDRCRGPVDLAARHEQAAGGGHHQQAQYHCNHQFDQRETTLRCLRRGWQVRHSWLVMLMSDGVEVPPVARSSLHCTPTLQVMVSAMQTTLPLASGATVACNPSS